MAPNINNPGGVKNDPDEIRDGVVSDATRFPGGFIDEQITAAGAAVQVVGQSQLSNASFVQPFSVVSEDLSPRGVDFRPDGSQLYVIGKNSGRILQYSLSTAFDVSTASFDTSFDVTTQDFAPRGLALNPDGGEVYVVGRNSDEVFEYGLSTPFDVSTASLNTSFDTSSQDSDPRSLFLKPDGTEMYLVGATNQEVFQYSLSTAFDVSTASLNTSFIVDSQDTAPRGVTLSDDGTRMYMSGTDNNNIFQYSLSTPFRVSTASFDTSIDVAPQDGDPRGIVFKPDGSYLYLVGSNNSSLFQYVVGTIGGELG